MTSAKVWDVGVCGGEMADARFTCDRNVPQSTITTTLPHRFRICCILFLRSALLHYLYIYTILAHLHRLHVFRYAIVVEYAGN
jgi:hypothetical protein